ncbi:MAG TPA: YifB family Mg chelatase-like AAA ATPase [Candidatus Saccharimonadia bacterium]|nr:YifB family Mg chelatase-like AAA ATPase [Candidatus Saccharimonadia bacterium]
MLATTYAPAIIGIDSHLISIECDMTNGLPGFVIVGLGDKAVDESRERVRSAIKNSQLMLPPKRITLNLAPADLPKDGSSYDLGMAVAVLAASGQIDASLFEGSLFMGELALDGTIRPVRGAIIAAEMTHRGGFERLFVAPENAAEAALSGQTKVFAVSSLLELYQHLVGHTLLSPFAATAGSTLEPADSPVVDFSLIYGQVAAKRAVEIAAAGGHNLLLTGPPGTGKTLLSKAIMGILPQPTFEESIEISKLHNLAGRQATGIMRTRPFRSPHHTASSVALIGGGTKPRPGEISLSHGGVLFLDELPEFPRGVLEVLRQPLEDGSITVARAAGVATFPARFMLVATRNPCPCGFAGDPDEKCQCEHAAINRYQRKISGPLLDRIDIVTEVARIDQQAIIRARPAESSADIAGRVQRARTIQQQRAYEHGVSCNAHMSTRDIQKHCTINNETTDIASHAMSNLSLSARGYSRILKVARTIADLEASSTIQTHHFTEALQYRPRLPETRTNHTAQASVNG